MDEVTASVCARLEELGFNPYVQVGKSHVRHCLIRYHDIRNVAIETAHLGDGEPYVVVGRKPKNYLAIYNYEDSTVTIANLWGHHATRSFLLDGSHPFKDGLAYRS